MGIVLAKRNDTDAELAAEISALAAEISAVRREHIHLSTADVELLARGRLLLKRDGPPEGSALERYDFLVESIRRSEPSKPRKEVRALAWNSLSEEEQFEILRDEANMNKMDYQELLGAWYKQLDASGRRRFRSQQAEIDRELAAQGKAIAETEGRGGDRFNGRPTSPDIAPRAPKAPTFKNDSNNLRQIVKAYGIMPLAKMICTENDAHRVTEAEFMVFCGEHAAAKGMTLGKLLNSNTGEGALLAKAAAICRHAEYARQASTMSIRRASDG
jgi:hypothetical protein